MELKNCYDKQVAGERIRRMSIIEQRKMLQSHCESTAEDLKSVEDELKDRMEENELRIAELMSTEDEDPSGNQDERFLAQLISLYNKGDDLNSQCMSQLELKIKEMSTSGDEELAKVQSELDKLVKRESRTIQIKVTNQQVVKELTIKSPTTSPKLKIISHLIFSVIDEGRQNEAIAFPQSREPLLATPTLPTINLDELIFDIIVKHHNKRIGSISIKPSPSFDSQFIRQLAEFCSTSYKKISQDVSKVKFVKILFK